GEPVVGGAQCLHSGEDTFRRALDTPGESSPHIGPQLTSRLCVGKFFAQSGVDTQAANHTGRDDPPILTGHGKQRRTVVKRGFVVAVGGAAIVIAGLSGCSSDETKSEGPNTPADTSAPGTASVSAPAAPNGGATLVMIDGQDQNVAGTVVCSAMGGNM